MATRKTAARANKEKQLATLLSDILGRRDLANRIHGTSFESQRDLYAVLGYRRELTFSDYEAAYDRGDIAQRIIDAAPIATWRRKPVISNDTDPDIFTSFELAWADLSKKRRLFHYFERADKLAGIGRYGCLLLGTSDVKKSDDMARPMAQMKGLAGLLYLLPLTEQSAEVDKTDDDPRSERFGLPETYKVTTADSGALAKTAKTIVHWSRIIHIAEGLREDDIYGTPRLKAVMNRLYDIDKIAGGSAEIFWQAAKRIMVLQAKEGFSAVDSNDSLTELMDELIHGLRRVIDIQGYEVKMLETADVHPDESFRVALALVSGVTGIPQRILIGSEQGKMASTQDEVNWNGRIADRQINYAEPVVLRQFIDRMIAYGILPAPEQPYIVTWQSLFELSDKEKAQIGLLKARTIAAYVGTNGGNYGFAQTIVPINELRGELLNLRAQKIENAVTKGGGQTDTTAAPKPVDTPKPPTKKKPANVVLNYSNEAEISGGSTGETAGTTGSTNSRSPA